MEKFLRTLLRNRDLRENAAVRYFLTQQDDFESFLGDVGLYSWAYTSLSSIDTKNLSFDVLKAVAQSEIESRGSDGRSEPAHFTLVIPKFDSQQAFTEDLEDRLLTLTTLQNLLSTQAKI